MCNRLPRQRSWRSFFGLRRVGTGWGGGRGRRGQRRVRGGADRRAAGAGVAGAHVVAVAHVAAQRISVAALKQRLNPHSLEGLETLVGYGMLSSSILAWGGGGKGDRRSSPIGWSSLSLPSGVEHGQRLTFLISIGWEVSRPRLARSGSDSVTSATGPHCFGTQAERQPRWECPTQSAYTKMGLYDLAIADYSRVVALDGGSAHAFHNRGISQAATRVCPRERELRSPPQAARRARAARPTCRMGLPPSRRRPRRRRRRC